LTVGKQILTICKLFGATCFKFFTGSEKSLLLL